jgi:hypothetical protein
MHCFFKTDVKTNVSTSIEAALLSHICKAVTDSHCHMTLILMPNVFPIAMTSDVNIMLISVILCAFCVNFTVDTGHNMFHLRDHVSPP